MKTMIIAFILFILHIRRQRALNKIQAKIDSHKKVWNEIEADINNQRGTSSVDTINWLIVEQNLEARAVRRFEKIYLKKYRITSHILFMVRKPFIKMIRWIRISLALTKH